MSTEWPGLRVVVQSTHIDMFGHVNHTCYLEYMEWARFAWAEHHGFPIPKMVAEEHMGPAILRVQIQYRRECRLGDELLVTASALSARRQIGRIRQTITDVRTGELACDAELTFVMMDLHARKAVPLPDEFVRMVPEDPATPSSA
jgi:YbgC/YbaW family acyl-CoA thioester hydrolase